MKRTLTLVFALMAFIAVETTDAKSRSGGGGSSRSYSSKSYSSKSYSSKSSKKSTGSWGNAKVNRTTKKVAPALRSSHRNVITSPINKSTKGFAQSKSTKVKSTNVKSKVTKSTAPKTALDKKMAKKTALQSKNNAAGKKYGSKKNAESAYRKKMASSNKYTSKTPPSTRPSSVPQTVAINGRSSNVTYNILPGGGYAYGYMDPITRTFMAVSAAHMIADVALMSRAGYGSYDSHGNPIYRQRIIRQPAQTVVYRDSTPMSTTNMVITVLIILSIVGLIGFAIKQSFK